MIEGLKLDVRAEELVAALNERVATHRAKVDAYSAQLRRLGDIGPDPEDDDVVAELRDEGRRVTGLNGSIRSTPPASPCCRSCVTILWRGRCTGSRRRICDSRSCCPTGTGGRRRLGSINTRDHDSHRDSESIANFVSC